MPRPRSRHRTSSTSTAAPSPWATRWGRPAPSSPPPCSTRCRSAQRPYGVRQHVRGRRHRRGGHLRDDCRREGIMALGKFAVDYEQRVDYPRLRAERLQRAKEQINKAGLGAVVTWDEANVRYLTGYYITTPNRPLEAQFCLLRPQRRPAHHRRATTRKASSSGMPWMGGRIHAPAGIAKIAAFTARPTRWSRTWSTRSSTSWCSTAWRRSRWASTAPRCRTSTPRPSRRGASRWCTPSRSWTTPA